MTEKDIQQDDSEVPESTYTISEVAELSGITADTLRYYEKIGLLDSPERGAGKKRMYNRQDIGKVKFLTYLKRTNMPLKKIMAYVQRYNEQDDPACYALLDEHRQVIEDQIAELNITLSMIQYKLEHFQRIKDG